LASYSPASLVNSFRDAAGEIVSMKPPESYVAFICRLCERLGADVYLPFASQASFERTDSEWANQYRTDYADLERLWRGRTRLLPPYTTLTLADLSHQSTPSDAYRPAVAARRAARTDERLAEEHAAMIDSIDAGCFGRCSREASRSRPAARPWSMTRGAAACGSSRPAIAAISSFRCRR
jgi:hypothetical protein